MTWLTCPVVSLDHIIVEKYAVNTLKCNVKVQQHYRGYDVYRYLHNHFKWDEKETKIWHLLFHRIWTMKLETFLKWGTSLLIEKIRKTKYTIPKSWRAVFETQRTWIKGLVTMMVCTYIEGPDIYCAPFESLEKKISFPYDLRPKSSRNDHTFKVRLIL